MSYMRVGPLLVILKKERERGTGILGIENGFLQVCYEHRKGGG